MASLSPRNHAIAKALSRRLSSMACLSLGWAALAPALVLSFLLPFAFASVCLGELIGYFFDGRDPAKLARVLAVIATVGSWWIFESLRFGPQLAQGPAPLWRKAFVYLFAPLYLFVARFAGFTNAAPLFPIPGMKNPAIDAANALMALRSAPRPPGAFAALRIGFGAWPRCLAKAPAACLMVSTGLLSMVAAVAVAPVAMAFSGACALGGALSGSSLRSKMKTATERLAREGAPDFAQAEAESLRRQSPKADSSKAPPRL